jgi:hypothetical protein
MTQRDLVQLKRVTYLVSGDAVSTMCIKLLISMIIVVMKLPEDGILIPKYVGVGT